MTVQEEAMNNPTVQEVFEAFYDDYLDCYRPSARQAKTAFHIRNCKTGGLGSHTSTCRDCGYTHIHHNSCRDRNCPMCQEIPKEKWIDRQKEDILDAPYFHVVFTLPHELNALIYCNQKELYGLLYRASAETLMELAADSKYLGAKPGFLSVLHTWGSDMGYHPHLHVVALGGGLNPEGYFVKSGEDFFLPVRVISKVFRGKYMAGLKELIKSRKLKYEGGAAIYRNYYELQNLIDTCYHKEWIPYCKETFPDAWAVLEYLGRYTHRIAISNSRIVKLTDQEVTYMVKDYRNGGRWKELTVSGVEFIWRFLMHVLPKRFVRLRHYGLLSNRVKKDKMTLCRNLLGCRQYLSKLKGLDTAGVIYQLFGVDIRVCPICGGNNYGPVEKIPGRYNSSE